MPKQTISFSKYIAQLCQSEFHRIPATIVNTSTMYTQQYCLSLTDLSSVERTDQHHPENPCQVRGSERQNSLNSNITLVFQEAPQINPSGTEQQTIQYNQGIEQGIALQQIQTALKMLGKGMAPQLICDITEIPTERLRKIRLEFLYPK